MKDRRDKGRGKQGKRQWNNVIKKEECERKRRGRVNRETGRRKGEGEDWFYY